jgi:UDP-N-acetylglucosamine/UDP-N-acetylgalactosamine diphosphorylase
VETTPAEEFAPLKNGSGLDSPETVRRALSAQAAGWLRHAGMAVPNGLPVEISPLVSLEPADLASGGFGIKIEASTQ